ncbi:MAG TPA: polyprenyl synthetase family protein [Planctomycetaceae bacterium]|nr:polyprenyl synthetase family protein [Planctomycetaceae bacterium]HQZ67604.1 polyprenyl synthetase family protein [Planctomycetaceae bacterium]
MTSSAFNAHLSELRSLVEAALSDELRRATWPASLKNAVEYSLMAGGKRLRPVLVLLANEACGGKREDAILAACAIEMIHTYSLIHDDLPSMDDDDFRRGRPTSHKVFGEALAVLAGDCLLTLAFETIASSPVAGRQITELARILASAAGGAGMVGGQVLDLEAERGGGVRAESGERKAETSPITGCESSASAVEKRGILAAFTGDLAASRSRISESEQNESNQSPETRVAELSQIHKMKTGALIAGALELGAVTALADDESRIRLRNYGHFIGLAFQIADDLLDVTGDQSKLGKKPGRDADLGKLTYPGLLGIEVSREKAAQLVHEACQALETFGERSVWLKELARFIVERDH